MALGVRPGKKPKRGAWRASALFGLALSSASCVPVAVAPPVGLSAAAPALSFAAAVDIPLPVTQAALPGALPALAATAVPAAASHAFEGRTGLDQLRSLDCLAQAIYYEARSEGEDGQRAVAQVVLNRVRHPAWPNSVCGVVYQGPMRPGGGCQFTFTCDGSLAARPQGLAWARARLLAAEALAGRAYEPVGTSTHYHTSAVSPTWAPRLAATTRIGAHNFYRLPGRWGEATAFNAPYTGSEPLPRPTTTLVRRAAPVDFGALAQSWAPPSAPPPSDIPQDPRWTVENPPPSTVRDEYRQSGQWRSDAPVAITGR